MTDYVCGCGKFVLNLHVRLRSTGWCSVGQGRFGGVEDTVADWHDPGKEPAHQAGTRQPSRFCSTQRNVSVNEMPKWCHCIYGHAGLVVATGKILKCRNIVMGGDFVASLKRHLKTLLFTAAYGITDN